MVVTNNTIIMVFINESQIMHSTYVYFIFLLYYFLLLSLLLLIINNFK